MQKIKVLLVDDHLVVRMGLSAVLRFEKDIQVVAEAEDGQQGLEAWRKFNPDVVVMDLRMPVLDGIGAITAIRAEDAEAKIVVLTTFEDAVDIRRAVDAGAKGCLLKNSSRSELAAAIRTVFGGGRFMTPEIQQQIRIAAEIPILTDRQTEVLRLLARGLTNKDIALCLRITQDGVKAHLAVIYNKLGVADRAEAVAVALRSHLLKESDL